MLRRLRRTQSSQKYTRVPFSTEQLQVSFGGPSWESPQRPQVVVLRSVTTRSS